MNPDGTTHPHFDCVVCGELCVDLPIRAVNRDIPLRNQDLIEIAAVAAGGGGIVANAGMVLSRLGLRTAALACVGDDLWGKVLTRLLQEQSISIGELCTVTDADTSVTAVLVGEDGEHSFAYHGGASRRLRRRMLLDRLELFARSKYALFGYYGLLPELQHDLPEVFQQIQETGCQTALDASGGGGQLQPLDKILAFTDLYIPSYAEAQAQTGLDNPEEMINLFRHFCPNGILGVKLGAAGALLELPHRAAIRIEPIDPPGPVVDTTGAGDSFFAGFIAGLANGFAVEDAAKIAAAAGACCVTGVGTIAAVRDFAATCDIARVPRPADATRSADDSTTSE